MAKEIKLRVDWSLIASVLIVALLAITAYNSIQIAGLQSRLAAGELAQPVTGRVAETGTDVVTQIYNEVVPEEGAQTDYGITFSTSGLQTLIGYAQSLELTGEEQERYVRIGSSPDTACEYCCGIGERGSLTTDGRIACGCGHNIALAGLIKHLIKQGYTDEQILGEIQRWKAYFFPRGYVTEVLEDRGISPESVGLPTQRGGC